MISRVEVSWFVEIKRNNNNFLGVYLKTIDHYHMLQKQ